jgi:hypothetical protein
LREDVTSVAEVANRRTDYRSIRDGSQASVVVLDEPINLQLPQEVRESVILKVTSSSSPRAAAVASLLLLSGLQCLTEVDHDVLVGLVVGQRQSHIH